MANLTITVDNELLKRARIRAIEQGTSVNAILSEYLRTFAGVNEAQARASAAILELAETNSEDPEARARASERGGRHWKREDLYER